MFSTPPRHGKTLLTKALAPLSAEDRVTFFYHDLRMQAQIMKTRDGWQARLRLAEGAFPLGISPTLPFRGQAIAWLGQHLLKSIRVFPLQGQGARITGVDTTDAIRWSVSTRLAVMRYLKSQLGFTVAILGNQVVRDTDQKPIGKITLRHGYVVAIIEDTTLAQPAPAIELPEASTEPEAEGAYFAAPAPFQKESIMSTPFVWQLTPAGEITEKDGARAEVRPDLNGLSQAFFVADVITKGGTRTSPPVLTLQAAKEWAESEIIKEQGGTSETTPKPQEYATALEKEFGLKFKVEGQVLTWGDPLVPIYKDTVKYIREYLRTNLGMEASITTNGIPITHIEIVLPLTGRAFPLPTKPTKTEKPDLPKAGKVAKAGEISVGDTVQYRLFNRPEGKSYGPVKTAEVIAIVTGRDDETLYRVNQESGGTLDLHRREIIRRVSAKSVRAPMHKAISRETLGPNFYSATVGDTKIYYSYNTPVAALLADGRFIRTDEKFSATTSRQLNQYVPGAEVVSASEFQQAIGGGQQAASAPNWREVPAGGGKLFFSYETPVAAVTPSGESIRRKRKFSATTSTQLNRYAPKDQFREVDEDEWATLTAPMEGKATRASMRKASPKALEAATAILNGEVSMRIEGYGVKTAEGLADLIEREGAAKAAEIILAGKPSIYTEWGLQKQKGLQINIENTLAAAKSVRLPMRKADDDESDVKTLTGKLAEALTAEGIPATSLNSGGGVYIAEVETPAFLLSIGIVDTWGYDVNSLDGTLVDSGDFGTQPFDIQGAVAAVQALVAKLGSGNAKSTRAYMHKVSDLDIQVQNAVSDLHTEADIMTASLEDSLARPEVKRAASAALEDILREVDKLPEAGLEPDQRDLLDTQIATLSGFLPSIEIPEFSSALSRFLSALNGEIIAAYFPEEEMAEEPLPDDALEGMSLAVRALMQKESFPSDTMSDKELHEDFKAQGFGFHKRVQFPRERGKRWANCLDCGAQWSVEDTNMGVEFEEISAGDGSCESGGKAATAPMHKYWVDVLGERSGSDWFGSQREMNNALETSHRNNPKEIAAVYADEQAERDTADSANSGPTFEDAMSGKVAKAASDLDVADLGPGWKSWSVRHDAKGDLIVGPAAGDIATIQIFAESKGKPSPKAIAHLKSLGFVRGEKPNQWQGPVEEYRKVAKARVKQPARKSQEEIWQLAQSVRGAKPTDRNAPIEDRIRQMTSGIEGYDKAKAERAVAQLLPAARGPHPEFTDAQMWGQLTAWGLFEGLGAAVGSYLQWEQEQGNKASPAMFRKADPPTQAQRQAGNYKKEHRKFQGLDISIENPKGSTRKGESADGKKWETKMKYDYGYIRRTEGEDEEKVDVYVGPNEDASNAFIVKQNNPETGEYDEDKVMLGFDDEAAAKEAYLAHYDDPRFFGSMEIMPIKKFKEAFVKNEPPFGLQKYGRRYGPAPTAYYPIVGEPRVSEGWNTITMKIGVEYLDQAGKDVKGTVDLPVRFRLAMTKTGGGQTPTITEVARPDHQAIKAQLEATGIVNVDMPTASAIMASMAKQGIRAVGPSNEPEGEASFAYVQKAEYRYCDLAKGPPAPMCVGEFRLIPTSADPMGGNTIACKKHFLTVEIPWRKERNKDLSPEAQYPLPEWESLKVNDEGKAATSPMRKRVGEWIDNPQDSSLPFPWDTGSMGIVAAYRETDSGAYAVVFKNPQAENRHSTALVDGKSGRRKWLWGQGSQVKAEDAKQIVDEEMTGDDQIKTAASPMRKEDWQTVKHLTLTDGDRNLVITLQRNGEQGRYYFYDYADRPHFIGDWRKAVSEFNRVVQQYSKDVGREVSENDLVQKTSKVAKALAPNEIKAKAYLIGRALEKQDWASMGAQQAEDWCVTEAKKRGASQSEAKQIAFMAMQYVIAGSKGNAVGEELESAEDEIVGDEEPHYGEEYKAADAPMKKDETGAEPNQAEIKERTSYDWQDKGVMGMNGSTMTNEETGLSFEIVLDRGSQNPDRRSYIMRVSGDPERGGEYHEDGRTAVSALKQKAGHIIWTVLHGRWKNQQKAAGAPMKKEAKMGKAGGLTLIQQSLHYDRGRDGFFYSVTMNGETYEVGPFPTAEAGQADVEMLFHGTEAEQRQAEFMRRLQNQSGKAAGAPR